MTRLLEKAINEISQLPEGKQDRLATLMRLFSLTH